VVEAGRLPTNQYSSWRGAVQCLEHIFHQHSQFDSCGSESFPQEQGYEDGSPRSIIITHHLNRTDMQGSAIISARFQEKGVEIEMFEFLVQAGLA